MSCISRRQTLLIDKFMILQLEKLSSMIGGPLEAVTKTAQFDEIVEILFEPGAGCGGGGQPREHTLAQCGSVLPLHHADCGLPAVEGG